MNRRQLQEYFTFSKRERRGVMVLVIILVLVIAASQLMKLFERHDEVDMSAFQKEIARFKAAQEKNEQKQWKTHSKDAEYKDVAVELFPFDHPGNL